MKKILLTVAYDGTSYYGWQKKKYINIKKVQRSLEEGLSVLFGKTIECVGASRTDKGVHALGQRVTIEVDTTIPAEKIPLAAKSFLPDDIVIVKGEDVSNDFHVRYDVLNKTYEYRILNSRMRNPLLRHYTEFIYEELDVEKMREASKHFIGEHDFKAFCSTETEVKSTVREIYSIKVDKSGDIITISVNGNGFLYNMIRIIAGTLIEVGKGKFEPNKIISMIESKDRRKAGITAGPSGLCLMCINYEKKL